MERKNAEAGSVVYILNWLIMRSYLCICLIRLKLTDLSLAVNVHLGSLTTHSLSTHSSCYLFCFFNGSLIVVVIRIFTVLIVLLLSLALLLPLLTSLLSLLLALASLSLLLSLPLSLSL